MVEGSLPLASDAARSPGWNADGEGIEPGLAPNCDGKPNNGNPGLKPFANKFIWGFPNTSSWDLCDSSSWFLLPVASLNNNCCTWTGSAGCNGGIRDPNARAWVSTLWGLAVRGLSSPLSLSSPDEDGPRISSFRMIDSILNPWDRFGAGTTGDTLTLLIALIEPLTKTTIGFTQYFV